MHTYLLVFTSASGQKTSVSASETTHFTEGPTHAQPSD